MKVDEKQLKISKLIVFICSTIHPLTEFEKETKITKFDILIHLNMQFT